MHMHVIESHTAGYTSNAVLAFAVTAQAVMLVQDHMDLRYC